MWHRSTPHGLHYQASVLGMEFYDGWVQSEHNTFTDFYDDEYKLAGAISFKGIRAVKGSFQNSFFDYLDGIEGNYVKGLPRGSYASKNGERRGLVYDVDGTITGWPGTTVVPDRPFFTSSECEARPHWGNMSVCPHQYLSLYDANGYGNGNYFITRDDVGMADSCSGGTNCHYRQTGLSADHSFIIAPFQYDKRGRLRASIDGLPEGEFLRFGVCFPLNSTIVKDSTLIEMGSMEELMEDTTGTGYFVDNEVGVLFRRFKGGQEKGNHYTVDIDKDMPWSEDVDCISRAYPKYQTKSK